MHVDSACLIHSWIGIDNKNYSLSVPSSFWCNQSRAVSRELIRHKLRTWIYHGKYVCVCVMFHLRFYRNIYERSLDGVKWYLTVIKIKIIKKKKVHWCESVAFTVIIKLCVLENNKSFCYTSRSLLTTQSSYFFVNNYRESSLSKWIFKYTIYSYTTKSIEHRYT